MTALAIAAFSLAFALVAVALVAVTAYVAVLLMERRDARTVRRDARTVRRNAARDARIAGAARSWSPVFSGLDDHAAVLAVLEARP